MKIMINFYYYNVSYMKITGLIFSKEGLKNIKISFKPIINKGVFK